MLPGMPSLLGGTLPFDYSGSWETGAEGWDIIEGVLFGPPVDNPARTGEYCFASDFSTLFGDARFPLGASGGLDVTVTVWHRQIATQTTFDRERIIYYRIDDGEWVEAASVSNTSSEYAELTGTFEVPAGSSATVRLYGGQSIAFDDWSIVGVLPS